MTEMDEVRGGSVRPSAMSWKNGVGSALGIGSLALGIFVLPLAARVWPPSVLATYALTFRLVAILGPVVVLGSTVSLPRDLARAHDTSVAEAQIRSALVMIVASMVVVAVAVFVFRGSLTMLASADQNEVSSTALAVIILVCGSALVALAGAILRGLFRPVSASALNVVYIGIVPLVAILSSQSALAAISIIGGVSALVSVAVVVGCLRGRLIGPMGSLKRFILYGIERLPGEVALFGMFALPPLLVLQRSGSLDATSLSITISLVTAAGSIVAVVSNIALPHFSHMFASSSSIQIRTQIGRLVAVVVAGSLVFGILGFIFIPEVLSVYVGSEYANAGMSIRIAALAAGPFACFCGLRVIPEAYFRRPVMMRASIAVGAASALLYLILISSGSRLSAETVFCVSMIGLGLASVVLSTSVAREASMPIRRDGEG